MAAESVKSKKGWVSLSIENQSTSELNFTFVPDGTISGYITTSMDQQDRSVGMPSWENRPENNDIILQSITLTGAGTHRTRHSIHEGEEGQLQTGRDVNWPDLNDMNALRQEFNLYKYLITSRQDFCINGYLRFFGLPAGTYKLAIHGQGYETYIEKQIVIPGKERAFEFYNLIPK